MIRHIANNILQIKGGLFGYMYMLSTTNEHYPYEKEDIQDNYAIIDNWVTPSIEEI